MISLALSNAHQAARSLARPRVPPPSLARDLADLAEAHGFVGGLYIHLSPSQDPFGPSAQPASVVATPGFEGCVLDLEQDPLSARAVSSLTPFSWTMNELFPAQNAPFVRQLASWGVRAGVVAPAHHHLFGPAFLILFVRDLEAPGHDFAGLMLATAHFHAKATAGQALPVTTQAVSEHPDLLSAREIAVLRLAALGRTEQESAEALRLSRRTIQYHLASAAVKLGTPNKTAAVARAISRGLIVLHLDEPTPLARLAR